MKFLNLIFLTVAIYGLKPEKELPPLKMPAINKVDAHGIGDKVNLVVTDIFDKSE
jgi:hypothetical protein